MTRKLLLLLFISIILISTAPKANAAEKYVIAIIDDARIFAQFEIPAVVSYFTTKTELEVISFYSNIYGKPTSNELKKERLTLYFNNNQHNVRIIISQQDKVRQVDILVTAIVND
ncbi:MAG: hypothetical protein HRT52_10235 [Colwellia sp.]|nr:hypothetical protein [Colwellia sp.]